MLLLLVNEVFDPRLPPTKLLENDFVAAGVEGVPLVLEPSSQSSSVADEPQILFFFLLSPLVPPPKPLVDGAGVSSSCQSSSSIGCDATEVVVVVVVGIGSEVGASELVPGPSSHDSSSPVLFGTL